MANGKLENTFDGQSVQVVAETEFFVIDEFEEDWIDGKIPVQGFYLRFDPEREDHIFNIACEGSVNREILGGLRIVNLDAKR